MILDIVKVNLERGDTVQVTMPKPISNIKSFLPVEAEKSVTKV
jgi:ribosomal protein S17